MEGVAKSLVGRQYVSGYFAPSWPRAYRMHPIVHININTGVEKEWIGTLEVSCTSASLGQTGVSRLKLSFQWKSLRLEYLHRKNIAQ